jgi:hypothetical protein
LNELNEKTQFYFIRLIGFMLISFRLTLMVSSNGCSFSIIYMGVRYLIVEYNPVISFVQSVYMAFVIQCSIEILVIGLLVILVERTL